MHQQIKGSPDDVASNVHRIVSVLAKKGINIEGFAGASVGGGGALVLVTNDEAGTRRALSDAGFRSREIELVTADS